METTKTKIRQRITLPPTLVEILQWQRFAVGAIGIERTSRWARWAGAGFTEEGASAAREHASAVVSTGGDPEDRAGARLHALANLRLRAGASMWL